MIALFRKLRQRMISGNHLTKYLMYASGEIILVVIGILIALQVNNWNQERHERKVEIKMLKELKTDLEVTLTELAGDMQFLRGNIDSGAVMLDRIQMGIPYDASFQKALERMSGYSPIWPRSITYENLKSSGIDLISNDSIRFLMTDIFGQRILRVRAIESSLADNITRFQDAWRENYIITGKKDNGSITLSLTSFDSIRGNKGMINAFVGIHNQRIFMFSIYQWLKESVDKLNSMVALELEGKDN